MIFVTVGTHEQPFNRLIQKVDELKRDGIIKDNVIIQTGFSTYEPKYCQWSKLIPYQQMVKNVADARIVITHGGYVGLSIATLLSQHHKVMAVDIVPEKVELINNKKSPIQDEYIEKYLAEKELNLTATLDAKEAYSDADFVVIAAPTNYDSKKNFFDTSAVEAVIKLVIEYNPEAIMVIKSTIPVTFVETNCKKNGPIKQTLNIIRNMDKGVFEPSLVTVWPEDADNSMIDRNNPSKS